MARLLLLRAVLAALLIPALIGGSAHAAAPDRTNQQRLELTIRYLQEVQNLDGGFAGKPGEASDPTFSAWVAYALAAASINPQDQKKPGGKDVYSYLLANTAALESTTDFERALLAVLASGTDPHNFGGIDLVKRVTDRQLADGGFAQSPTAKVGQVNTTAFAVIALSQIPEPGIAQRLSRAVTWLQAAQGPTGAWGWQQKGGYSTDMTGAVIEALNAAGARGTPEQTKALEYLRTVQSEDGGFSELRPGGQTNAMSTAWAVQGLWSAGIDPRGWRKAGGDPLDAMASFQDPKTGAVRYLKDSDMNLIWSTAQVAPAFAGQALPIPPAPRKASSPDQNEEELPTDSDSPGTNGGDGGFEREKGGGVIAGGGGKKAPLFSKPKAQSQGSTTGGVRETKLPEKKNAKLGRSPSGKPGPEIVVEQPDPTKPVGAPDGTSSTAKEPDHAEGAAGKRGVDTVTGRLLAAEAIEPGPDIASAPGLRGAQSGGSVDPIVMGAVGIGLLSALLFGAIGEIRLNPRRPVLR